MQKGSSFFLPEDIVVEIILMLPAKSIGRCRCVSKPWRDLLSQPQFIKSHLDRIRKLQEQSLILLSDSGYCQSVTFGDAHHLFDEITDPPKKLSFPGHSDSWFRVLASCDGLVFLEDRVHKIFLVNPVTREIREVPLPTSSTLDNFSCSTVYGLGYDSVNVDYKIVSLSYYHIGNDYGHEPDCSTIFFSVYSVKNGTWKKAQSFPYDYACGYITRGVFVDGYIHWFTSEETETSLSYSSGIAAFDLAEEKFYEVPCPSSTGFSVDHYLVELGGCLCIYPIRICNKTDVWIMKEYGNKESWTKFSFIDHELAAFKPLCMLGQEQLVLMKDKKWIKYNLEKATFEDIVVHGISDDFQVGRPAEKRTFIESLLSPKASFAVMEQDRER